MFDLQKYLTFENKEDAEKELKQMTFVSYPYEKYGEVVLAFKTENGFNIQLMNTSKELHNGTLKGFNDTLIFSTFLAERIALCLNHFKGMTNEEIKKAALTIGLPKGC